MKGIQEMASGGFRLALNVYLNVSTWHYYIATYILQQGYFVWTYMTPSLLAKNKTVFLGAWGLFTEKSISLHYLVALF